MSLIVPGLYVGGLFSAKSQVQLDANNITHLCSVLRQRFEVPNRQQIVFEVDDSPSENLSMHFENACLFIHGARSSGGHVLVHCACGVSRSVTIALAYLLVTTDFPLSKLVKAIRGARHCACPNYGFMQQLIDFEKSENLTALRERLFSIHGEWPRERKLADAEALQIALTSEEYFLAHKVYPNENSLSDAASAPSGNHISTKEGEVIIKDIPPIHRLDSSLYTVYCQEKSINLGEFLSTRTHSSSDGPPPDDESCSTQQ